MTHIESVRYSEKLGVAAFKQLTRFICLGTCGHDDLAENIIMCKPVV